MYIVYYSGISSPNPPTQHNGLRGLVTPNVQGLYTLVYKRKLEFMMKLINHSAFCSQDMEYYCLVSHNTIELSLSSLGFPNLGGSCLPRERFIRTLSLCNTHTTAKMY